MTKNAKTKTTIEETFLKLLNDQPLNEISVADITKACGFNRNTFYYHYRSIADLINSAIKGLIAELLTEHPPRFDSLEDCFLAAIRFASANKTAILNIYHSTSRAIFERHLWKLCDFAVETYLDSLPPRLAPASRAERNLVHDLLKFELFGFTIDWVNHQMPDDVTDKIQFFAKYLKRRLDF